MFKRFGCAISDDKFNEVTRLLRKQEHPLCIASAVGLSPSEVYAVEAAMRLEKLSGEPYGDTNLE